jgi:predicted metalloprotease
MTTIKHSPARRIAKTIGAVTIATATVAGIGSQVLGGTTNAAAGTTSTTHTTEPPVRTTDRGRTTGTGSSRKVDTKVHRYGETANLNGTTNWASMDEFMTFVLKDVDGYWTAQMKRAGLDEPRVTYDWIAPGESRKDCSKLGYTNDSTAEYCGDTDTIFFSKQAAADLWNGTLTPAQDGKGGDFAVAMAIAHEMGHNIEHELDYYDRKWNSAEDTRAMELGADCLAGLWTQDAARRNLLDPGDLQEGMDVALALGDYNVTTFGHHGTPSQRQAAFLAGYRGSFSSCKAYMQS